MTPEGDDMRYRAEHSIERDGCRHPESALSSNADVIVCTRCGESWPNRAPLSTRDIARQGRRMTRGLDR